MPETQERITYTFGERYEDLRALAGRRTTQAEKPVELDYFLSRLFGEVLSQPGFGFHADLDAGQVAANLIELVQKIPLGGRRRTLAQAGTASPRAASTSRWCSDGVIAAQYLASWQAAAADAVFIAPAYTFLMNNRPVEHQFWLDAGSNAWFERLYQPLTHPYVLSRAWRPGRLWTAAEEFETNRETLYRLVLRPAAPLSQPARPPGPERAERRAATSSAGCCCKAFQRQLQRPGSVARRSQSMARRDPPAPQPGSTSWPIERGKMGISAVPGSRQDLHPLAPGRRPAHCAAWLRPDQEILIVTLVNSAVDNFCQPHRRLSRAASACCPNIGYRVRTLHGLAHDIVRERPEPVGLANDFQIIDEREADAHPAAMWPAPGCAPTYDPGRLPRSRDIDEMKPPQTAPAASCPIWSNPSASACHPLRQRPGATPPRPARRSALRTAPAAAAPGRDGLDIYADYQRALTYRGAVDFDDLIRLALQALQARRQPAGAPASTSWPYILEDEAQDSSRLQEEILRLLAGPQRQLGARRRPQPGHLRDLHHRQPASTCSNSCDAPA